MEDDEKEAVLHEALQLHTEVCVRVENAPIIDLEIQPTVLYGTRAAARSGAGVPASPGVQEYHFVPGERGLPERFESDSPSFGPLEGMSLVLEALSIYVGVRGVFLGLECRLRAAGGILLSQVSPSGREGALKAIERRCQVQERLGAWLHDHVVDLSDVPIRDLNTENDYDLEYGDWVRVYAPHVPHGVFGRFVGVRHGRGSHLVLAETFSCRRGDGLGSYRYFALHTILEVCRETDAEPGNSPTL